ncbi:MAG: hypothetical protein HKP44_15395 [Desulfofustis sp.]|nr:hypothetical protein [Desulfofustis sp.]
MEDGEELDYRSIGIGEVGMPHTVLIYPGPMTYTVNTVPIYLELIPDIGD